MLWIFKASVLSNLLQFFWSQTQQRILWLQIGMNDVTHSVKKIKTNQALLCNDPCQGNRYSFILKCFDHFQ